jgi:hypothetical protein
MDEKVILHPEFKFRALDVMTGHGWVAEHNVLGIKVCQYMQNDDILLHILYKT